MVGLTPKQEAFAHHYVQTGNASEAYRASYDSSRMKMESVHRKAHDLVQNVKVASRVQELQAAQLRDVDVTATDIARVAWQIANEGKANHGARVSALALLAKRHHEFSDKHEISSDVRLQAMQAVANMDAAQLRALADTLNTDT